MDCSDGQVARFTKKFSKYGTEMDYMAHLIDHPLMNLAIWVTYLEMNMMNPLWLSFIFIIFISCELITRNIYAFDYFHKKIYSDCNSNKKSIKGWFRYFFVNITQYPTFIVCISWIIVIDYGINNGFSLYIVLIWMIVCIIKCIRATFNLVRNYYYQ